MWKSNKNPWSHSEPDEWSFYCDIDTAIIEEAFQENQHEVLLDDYHINFNHFVQISNCTEKNQRPVKRMINQQNDRRLREERFLANIIQPSAHFIDTGSLYFTRVVERYYGFTSMCESWDDVTLQMLIEKSADGFIFEGKLIGQQRQGEYLSRQLLHVKNNTEREIYECCARLYCMNSFLYKKLNEWMRLAGDREHKMLWESKIPTLGPFACLLCGLAQHRYTSEILTVYRGASLPKDLIEQYRQKCYHPGDDSESLTFTAFTSTSRNEAIAEIMADNVLFIIDTRLDQSDDVSPYSNYPDEEEQLLKPDFSFTILSCNFDQTRKKWIIHLQSEMIKPIPILEDFSRKENCKNLRSNAFSLDSHVYSRT
jgi:hypothetical protein